jgi:hypothetical protein
MTESEHTGLLGTTNFGTRHLHAQLISLEHIETMPCICILSIHLYPCMTTAKCTYDPYFFLHASACCVRISVGESYVSNLRATWSDIAFSHAPRFASRRFTLNYNTTAGSLDGSMDENTMHTQKLPLALLAACESRSGSSLARLRATWPAITPRTLKIQT